MVDVRPVERESGELSGKARNRISSAEYSVIWQPVNTFLISIDPMMIAYLSGHNYLFEPKQ